jgi:hypothetical protein
LHLTDGIGQYMRRPKGISLDDRQACALVDKENSLRYAIDFPRGSFHGRNIFKNTQVSGNDDCIGIAVSNARSAKQFRRYGAGLLQHAADGRNPGTRIAYNMNEHNDRPRPARLPLSAVPRLVKFSLLRLGEKMFEPGANAKRNVLV